MMVQSFYRESVLRSKFFISALLLLLGGISFSFGQLTNQDCLNAIPVCQNTYVQPNSYTGRGSDTLEIDPTKSCLNSGERNDVWYIFTVSVSGTLNFSLFPNNPNNDYDFALYNLTNHNCQDIRDSAQLEVACNFSANLTGCGGITGANGNTTGPCGLMNAGTVSVIAGQTYVLNVSNYSQTNQNGYTLDFSASSATIYDNIPPLLNTVSPLSCGANSLDLMFNENMLFSSFQPSDFTLTGPGGTYNITSITAPNCTNGSAYDKNYHFTFSPAITVGGSYTLSVVGNVTDICGNPLATPNTRTLSVAGITVNPSSTNVSCNGGNNGTATVNVVTGNGPFSYQWSNGVSTTNTATNLPVGIYVVTVSAPNSCPATATYNITQPASMADSALLITPATCGSNNGALTLFITGGNIPYSYLWSPNGSTTLNQSNLAAGNYTISVTDNKSCTFSKTYTVGTLSTLNAVPQIQNVNCFGGSTGSITLNTTGGSGNYTFQWAGGISTTNSASNLSAGNYTATVMDGACLIVFNSLTVSQPSAPVSGNIASTQTTCGNNDGTATLSNVSGGVSPYSFLWNTGAASSSISNLASGTYTCTITDLNGCTLEKTTSISPSNGHTVVINYLNDSVTCFGWSDGGVALIVSGGVSPYTFQWSNGLPPNSSQNSLSAGLYTASVTDASGCVVNVSATIHSPSAISLNLVNLIDVSCYGNNTGSANVSASGGTGALIYQWSPTGGTSASAVNLAAGNYTITVTDANGCNSSLPVSIMQPSSVLSAPVAVTHTSCGNSNGTLITNASGGVPPFTYLWSNGNTSSSLGNLPASTYTVTVTDANGCSLVQQQVVNASTAPVLVSVVADSLSCYGYNDGSITVVVNNGSLPYNFTWSNGGTTATISGLSPGVYNATITDNGGCTLNATATVGSPDPINIDTLNVSHILCYGDLTGAITTSVTGGSGGFTYQWSGGGGVLQNTSGLPAGSYSMTVTDNMGCTTSASFSITQPSAALSSVNNITQTSCGGNNGAIVAAANGGTAPYTYLWSDGSSSSSLFNLSPGIYTLTITDNNGCTLLQTETINPSTPVSFAINNITNVSCHGNSNGAINISPSGGVAPYSYQWSNGFGGSNNTNLVAGIYTVTVTDAVGCSTTLTDTVTEPAPLSVITSPSTSICLGQSYLLAPTFGGGTTPYSYVWSNGATSSSITVSPSALTTYTVTVTDAHGCSNSDLTTLSIYDPMVASLPADTMVCQDNLVVLAPIILGGDGNYIYSWSTGTNLPFENITATKDSVVSVHITDGCNLNPTTLSVNIHTIPTPVLEYTFDIDKGCQPLAVSFTSTVTTVAGSTYLWSFGDDSMSTDTHPVHTFYYGAIYHPELTVTTPSPYNCTGSFTAPDGINVLNIPIAAFSYTPEKPTILNSTILFYNNSSFANSYQWSFGDGASSTSINPEHYYMAVGTYPLTLIASNDGMCYDTLHTDLEIKDAYAFYVPEGFTPNGDGKNDVLQFKAVSAQEITVTIFNRWGQLVFEDKGNPVSWNGSINNGSEVVQKGSYVYIADVIDDWGKKHRLKGTVAVIK